MPNKTQIKSSRLIIGETVKTNRLKLNLTQKELAELCKTTTQTINTIENGKTNFGIDLYLKMKEIFGGEFII